MDHCSTDDSSNDESNVYCFRHQTVEHSQLNCPDSVCAGCKRKGHVIQNCTRAGKMTDKSSSDEEDDADKMCYICQTHDHATQNCIPCKNCGLKGHLAPDCKVAKSKNHGSDTETKAPSEDTFLSVRKDIFDEQSGSSIEPGVSTETISGQTTEGRRHLFSNDETLDAQIVSLLSNRESSDLKEPCKQNNHNEKSKRRPHRKKSRKKPKAPYDLKQNCSTEKPETDRESGELTLSSSDDEHVQRSPGIRRKKMNTQEWASVMKQYLESPLISSGKKTHKTSKQSNRAPFHSMNNSTYAGPVHRQGYQPAILSSFQTDIDNNHHFINQDSIANVFDDLFQSDTRSGADIPPFEKVLERESNFQNLALIPKGSETTFPNDLTSQSSEILEPVHGPHVSKRLLVLNISGILNADYLKDIFKMSKSIQISRVDPKTQTVDAEFETLKSAYNFLNSAKHPILAKKNVYYLTYPSYHKKDLLHLRAIPKISLQQDKKLILPIHLCIDLDGKRNIETICFNILNKTKVEQVQTASHAALNNKLKEKVVYFCNIIQECKQEQSFEDCLLLFENRCSMFPFIKCLWRLNLTQRFAGLVGQFGAFDFKSNYEHAHERMIDLRDKFEETIVRGKDGALTNFIATSCYATNQSDFTDLKKTALKLNPDICFLEMSCSSDESKTIIHEIGLTYNIQNTHMPSFKLTCATDNTQAVAKMLDFLKVKKSNQPLIIALPSAKASLTLLRKVMDPSEWQVFLDVVDGFFDLTTFFEQLCPRVEDTLNHYFINKYSFEEDGTLIPTNFNPLDVAVELEMRLRPSLKNKINKLDLSVFFMPWDLERLWSNPCSCEKVQFSPEVLQPMKVKRIKITQALSEQWEYIFVPNGTIFNSAMTLLELKRHKKALYFTLRNNLHHSIDLSYNCLGLLVKKDKMSNWLCIHVLQTAFVETFSLSMPIKHYGTNFKRRSKLTNCTFDGSRIDLFLTSPKLKRRGSFIQKSDLSHYEIFTVSIKVEKPKDNRYGNILQICLTQVVTNEMLFATFKPQTLAGDMNHIGYGRNAENVLVYEHQGSLEPCMLSLVSVQDEMHDMLANREVILVSFNLHKVVKLFCKDDVPMSSIGGFYDLRWSLPDSITCKDFTLAHTCKHFKLDQDRLTECNEVSEALYQLLKAIWKQDYEKEVKKRAMDWKNFFDNIEDMDEVKYFQTDQRKQLSSGMIKEKDAGKKGSDMNENIIDILPNDETILTDLFDPLLCFQELSAFAQSYVQLCRQKNEQINRQQMNNILCILPALKFESMEDLEAIYKDVIAESDTSISFEDCLRKKRPNLAELMGRDLAFFVEVMCFHFKLNQSLRNDDINKQKPESGNDRISSKIYAESGSKPQETAKSNSSKEDHSLINEIAKKKYSLTPKASLGDQMQNDAQNDQARHPSSTNPKPMLPQLLAMNRDADSDLNELTLDLNVTQAKTEEEKTKVEEATGTSRHIGDIASRDTNERLNNEESRSKKRIETEVPSEVKEISKGQSKNTPGIKNLQNKASSKKEEIIEKSSHVPTETFKTKKQNEKTSKKLIVRDKKPTPTKSNSKKRGSTETLKMKEVVKSDLNAQERQLKSQHKIPTVVSTLDLNETQAKTEEEKTKVEEATGTSQHIGDIASRDTNERLNNEESRSKKRTETEVPSEVKEISKGQSKNTPGIKNLQNKASSKKEEIVEKSSHVPTETFKTKKQNEKTSKKLIVRNKKPTPTKSNSKKRGSTETLKMKEVVKSDLNAQERQLKSQHKIQTVVSTSNEQSSSLNVDSRTKTTKSSKNDSVIDNRPQSEVSLTETHSVKFLVAPKKPSVSDKERDQSSQTDAKTDDTSEGSNNFQAKLTEKSHVSCVNETKNSSASKAVALTCPKDNLENVGNNACDAKESLDGKTLSNQSKLTSGKDLDSETKNATDRKILKEPVKVDIAGKQMEDDCSHSKGKDERTDEKIRGSAHSSKRQKFISSKLNSRTCTSSESCQVNKKKSDHEGYRTEGEHAKKAKWLDRNMDDIETDKASSEKTGEISAEMFSPREHYHQNGSSKLIRAKSTDATTQKFYEYIKDGSLTMEDFCSGTEETKNKTLESKYAKNTKNISTSMKNEGNDESYCRHTCSGTWKRQGLCKFHFSNGCLNKNNCRFIHKLPKETEIRMCLCTRPNCENWHGKGDFSNLLELFRVAKLRLDRLCKACAMIKDEVHKRTSPSREDRTCTRKRKLSQNEDINITSPKLYKSRHVRSNFFSNDMPSDWDCKSYEQSETYDDVEIFSPSISVVLLYSYEIRGTEHIQCAIDSFSDLSGFLVDIKPMVKRTHVHIQSNMKAVFVERGNIIFLTVKGNCMLYEGKIIAKAENLRKVNVKSE